MALLKCQFPRPPRPPFEQYELFAVGRHLADIFGERGAVLLFDHTPGDRAQRHGDDDVPGVPARRAGSRAALPVLGELVALVFEVDKRPVRLSPCRTMLPPLPPSPPSGPPKATNFSRRKCAEPAPPCPERANIFT